VGGQETVGDAQRVRWREGQRLDATDLTDEQAYLAGLGHRHATGPHDWGIVTGLWLTAARQGLLLYRGFAVDGYGRELVVPNDLVMRWPAVEPPVASADRPAAIDVWLRYCRVPGSSRDRVPEEARLRLTAASNQLIDPRRPPGVPSGDLSAGALLAAEPDRVWPVYLGRLVRIKRAKGTAPPVPPFRLAPVRRPYAGLRGANVEAPSGETRLELGGEAADRRSFAILTADDQGKLQRRVDLDADGRLSADAGAMLRGTDLGDGETKPASLRLAPGPNDQPRTSARLTFAEPLPPPPTQAWPWRLYRTKVKVDDRELDQLRVEIQHPGETDDPSHYRLVVGQSVNGRFEPSLTVSADGTVTVEDTLVTNGPVTQGEAGAGIGATGSGVVLDDILRRLAAGTITIDAAFGGAKVETGLLRIDLDPATSAAPKADTAFRYTVTLVNTTTGVVGHLQAFQTISLNQVRADPSPVVSGLRLAGGAGAAYPQQLYVPPGSSGQRLRVDTVALGIVPTGTLAYAAQTRSWIVTA
jgi:hypothetical protein